MLRENRQKDSIDEKGLIMAEVHINKPIEIEYINKAGLELIQYDKDRVKGLKIN